METQEVFKVQDLNQLIKLFAYEIQQRFEQICKVQHQNSVQQLQRPQVGQYLLDKYKDYTTSQPVQVKYIQKLVQRILQIFSFFKTRSKHQHLLTVFQQKINAKFQGCLGKRPIQVGDIFSYALQMVKPGFFSKPQSHSQRRRVFTRVPSRQNPKINIPQTKPRRTVSVTNASQSTTKMMPARTAQSLKVTNQQAFTKLYSIIGADKFYFLRTVDHANNIKREMLQRNQSTLKSIKMYSNTNKRVVTESDQFQSNANILSDLNNRAYQRKGINAPSINIWVNRKRRIATANKNRTKNNENTWCA